MLCQLTIDQQAFAFELSGEFNWGQDEVLYRAHPEVLAQCKWEPAGFAVMPLFSTTEWQAFQNSIRQMMRQLIQSLGVQVPDAFRLEDYHRYVTTDTQHQQVIAQTRFLTYRDLDVDFAALAGRISQWIGHPLRLDNPLLDKEIVILRISRPQSLDINPLHRDGYLPIWQQVLNVWLPVAGCNAASSLPVIPGSHFWNEQDVYRTEVKGAAIGGLSYHVPGIGAARAGLHLIRPNPAAGEALLFTPFLVHGAAINAQPDTTRMALEIRLYGGA